MSKLTPQFSANRTVRQYTESYYIPAATSYLKRSANKCAEGLQISRKLAEFNSKWGKIALGETTTKIVDGEYLFLTSVTLNGIMPEEISVELYAQGQENAAPERQEMKLVAGTKEKADQQYSAQFKSSRHSEDFTVRIVPNFEGAKTPLENNRILWQH
jgi:starch phosphorylase